MAAAEIAGEQRWVTLPCDEIASGQLAAEIGCPSAIARLLMGRGIGDASAARVFFEPQLDHLIDPMRMLGMAAAVARIQRAVAEGEPILIYGDYDVDGTVATVLLKTAIERIAPEDKPAKVTWHVPHRIREGYGMQEAILAGAAEAGVRLIISVDTGIRAFAAAAEAEALGLDLIVTDHHLPDAAAGLPHAVAILNPAQDGCTYPFASLCGAGVAFKLAHALLLAGAETPEQKERLRTVLVPSFLKMVAIATIADSVPLVGENRTIAALGLRELRNPIQPGLRALMEMAKLPLDRSPSATDVGFRLAPRINAAGRMDVASDVVELFLTRDGARARQLAEKLDRLNQDRRASEAAALEAIERELEVLRTIDGEFPAECIILDDAEWHRGVLGILASRVVERTSRPALILTHEAEQAHGSGRSVEGFHLLNALTVVDGCVEKALEGAIFSRFGGHAHAVGFSLPSACVDALRRRMRGHTEKALTAESLRPELVCDAEVRLEEMTPEFWSWLRRCEPFGNAHLEPVFLCRDAALAGPIRIIKEKHVCLEVVQGAARFSALGWNRTSARTDWPARCERMGLGEGTRIDLAFRLRENTHAQYGGLQLELVDVRVAHHKAHG